jgi:NTP pyrophosphatase (non-canonical NTP hydrolase)
MQEYAKKIHKNTIDKGFYAQIVELVGYDSPLRVDQKQFIMYLWRANRLMLIVSELGEALEGLRKNNFSSKPHSGGFVEELADTQIRLLDMFEAEDIDIEKVINEKMEYNDTRPRMRGDKIS